MHMNLSVLLSPCKLPIHTPLYRIVILLAYVIYLHHKLSRFVRGENGKSLESMSSRKYLDHVDDLKKHDELIAEHALKLDKRLAQAVRNVSTMRFKAFEQNASNQSFAIALVNELGDGVILSSLHHRDRVSVFAKPVSEYASSHDLTEEERPFWKKPEKHTSVRKMGRHLYIFVL
jgi:hypothetical protein